MRWSKYEEELLKSNYSLATWKTLLSIFKGRSQKSIKNKAVQLGLTRKEEFSIEGGTYLNYFTCDIHGKVYKLEVIYNKSNKPICPRCNRLLRTLPRKSSLRRKYREMEKK